MKEREREGAGVLDPARLEEALFRKRGVPARLLGATFRPGLRVPPGVSALLVLAVAIGAASDLSPRELAARAVDLVIGILQFLEQFLR